MTRKTRIKEAATPQNITWIHPLHDVNSGRLLDLIRGNDKIVKCEIGNWAIIQFRRLNPQPQKNEAANTKRVVFHHASLIQ
jgi:hypothetical protein